jgi:hypothetical protein
MKGYILFLDPSHNHPNSVPTPDDINGSEVSIHRYTGSHLARVQQRFVIKYGYDVHPIEGYNMLFVADSTSVPVPKVYAIYQSRDEKGVVTTYIVTQYVLGTTLLESWGSLLHSRLFGPTSTSSCSCSRRTTSATSSADRHSATCFGQTNRSHRLRPRTN